MLRREYYLQSQCNRSSKYWDAFSIESSRVTGGHRGVIFKDSLKHHLCSFFDGLLTKHFRDLVPAFWVVFYLLLIIMFRATHRPARAKGHGRQVRVVNGLRRPVALAAKRQVH